MFIVIFSLYGIWAVYPTVLFIPPKWIDLLQVAWHMFEHTLDVKDFIIYEMRDRLQESQVQEAMSWQDYTFKIDDLIS